MTYIMITDIAISRIILLGLGRFRKYYIINLACLMEIFFVLCYHLL
jgi:hypothetical protein